VQASVPLCPEFFLIIATGVRPLIFVAFAEYFSSCLRVETSALEDAEKSVRKAKT
jgi:hypothetical protein